MSTRPSFSFCLCPDSVMLLNHVDSLFSHAGKNWERHIFWADEGLSDKFWNQMVLQGLFPVYRMIVLRNAEKIEEKLWTQLSKALLRGNSQVWPIVCLEEVDSKGNFKIPSAATKTECLDFAEKKGWCWKQQGLTPQSLRKYLQDRVKQLGLQIETAALQRLAESLPPEAGSVESELAKLTLLSGQSSGSGRVIGLADLRTVANLPDLDPFALMRQMQAGQSREVWKSVLTEETKGNDPLFLLIALLRNEARQLWQVLTGDKYTGWGNPESKRPLATSLGIAGVAEIFDALYTADLQVKSGQCKSDQALESLIGKISLIFERKKKSLAKQI